MWFKWLEVPESNGTKQVEVVQTWEVRWTAITNGYGGSRPEIEVFKSEEDAVAFKKSLENAFKLIRLGTCTNVQLIKAK